MTCKNCVVDIIQFLVKLAGTKNSTIKQLLVDHLTRLDYAIIEDNGILMVNEEAMRELTDFCVEFGEVDKIEFNVDEVWQPLIKIDDVLQASWVDTIILKNKINIITKNNSPYFFSMEDFYVWNCRIYRQR